MNECASRTPFQVAMRVDVKLNRCVCIHSMSQVVDTTLQVLLYQRQIIPEPVHFMMRRMGDNDNEQFRQAYNDVKRVIRQSFRQRNSGHLKEFVILIGSSPHLPKEIYRIPVVTCTHFHDFSQPGAVCDTSFEGEDGDEFLTTSAYNISNATPIADCGAHCSLLTKREERQIFSSLTLEQNIQELLQNSNLTKNDKVFFFVGSSSDTDSSTLSNVGGVEEDDAFEIPDANVRKRRKVCHIVVKIRCAKNASPPPVLSKRRHQAVDNEDGDDLESASSKSCRSAREGSDGSGLDDDDDEENEKESVGEVESDRAWFRLLQYFKRV